MAQYIKTYPLSGSSLTINYPDGLVYFVQARDWMSYDTSDRNYLLIMPNNGSLVKAQQIQTSAITMVWYDNQGQVDHEDDPVAADATLDLTRIWREECIGADHPIESEHIQYTDPKCKTHQAWFTDVEQELDDNEQNWRVPGQGFRFRINVTIDIQGTPNFFNSNVDFYVTCGDPSSNRIRMAHSFVDEPGFIGGAAIIAPSDSEEEDRLYYHQLGNPKGSSTYDGSESLEYLAVDNGSLSRVYGGSAENKSIFFDLPYGLVEKHEILSNVVSLSLDGESIAQNSTVNFLLNDQLVAVAAKASSDRGTYLYVEKSSKDDITLGEDTLHDPTTGSYGRFRVSSGLNTPDDMFFFCPTIDEHRKSNNLPLCHLTTRSKFIAHSNTLLVNAQPIYGFSHDGNYWGLPNRQGVTLL